MSKLFSTPSLFSGSQQETVKQTVSTLYLLSDELTKAFDETEETAQRNLIEKTKKIYTDMEQSKTELLGRIKAAKNYAKEYADGLMVLEASRAIPLAPDREPYSRTQSAPAVYKDPFGIVHLEGRIVKIEETPAETPEEAPEEAEHGELLGRFRITGYTAEEGFPEGSPTASGEGVRAGYCAMNLTQMGMLGIHYGDQIYVDGMGTYTVMDCGCDEGIVDIWCETNAEAYAFTGYYDVYLVTDGGSGGGDSGGGVDPADVPVTNVLIGQLPVGYRPEKEQRFAAAAGMMTSTVGVVPDGGIYVRSEDLLDVSLDGITFRAYIPPEEPAETDTTTDTDLEG